MYKNIVDAYKQLDKSGKWLTSEQLEYGQQYGCTNADRPLRYFKSGSIAMIESNLSDLIEIVQSENPFEDAIFCLKDGQNVFAVYDNDESVNWFIYQMEGDNSEDNNDD